MTLCLAVIICILLVICLVLYRKLQAVRGVKSAGWGSFSDAQTIANEGNPLFATLSHELRTPLNGLLGIVQMLQEELGGDDEDLEAIEGCAHHMLAVISTLVNLTKMKEEWNELPEYREWVSPYELFEQLKKQLSFRAGLRGLKLEVVHQDKTTRLRGDSDHLKTIVEGLLLGSLESVSLLEIPTKRQILRLAWETREKEVIISLRNPLEVYSDARGIRILDAFKMTTGHHHARIPMEYLYWAVSSALLERYNGVLRTKEIEAGGAVTRVSFEMAQMQASPSERRPVGGLSLDVNRGRSTSAQLLPVKLSVLVAEDDPITRSLMSAVLKLMGQEVSFVTNGREVLDMISQSRAYDLILMDIDMPVMDGMSAAIALRNGESGEYGTKIPIVAVTAFNTLSDEGKFKRAGMDYYLPKPVKLRDLRSVLLEVVKQRKPVAGSAAR
ncbi:response regulator [Coraliomargarita parva]|uniref:response regulator n=1 Tax=Coraliomargarita parva TaxID=3014050 RepID=UPI0022B56BA1|nr:hybrid sensor histidine kinase/response regulator [Coraliomargarita parva]